MTSRARDAEPAPGDPREDGLRVSARDGGVTVDAPAYALEVGADRPFARLHGPDGRLLARLMVVGAVDTTDGLDGTDTIGPPRVVARLDAGGPAGADADLVEIEVPIASTRWASKRAVVECRPDAVTLRIEVEGRGNLADVRLLGGWHPVDRTWGSGWYRSRIEASTAFSAAPSDPRSIARSPNEAATLGVVGGGQPGRGAWFFTPPPLVVAFSREERTASDELPGGPWMTVGVATPIGQETFTGVDYEPLDGAFDLRLAYDGRTRVDGRWTSPVVVIRPGAPDPYTGIAVHVAALPAFPGRHHAWGRAGDDRPAWWQQPIFCGWGAQCAIAAHGDAEGESASAAVASAPAQSTQANYDRFLARLAVEGIRPGTVVIDDRWQRTYGTGEPDPERWPDLAGWIDRRHGAGQHVLLWWKAWDPGGLPAEWCVRTATGRAVAADPSNPAYRDFLAATMRRMVAAPPDGLGADGLKIDFTAQTPSGPGLVAHGPEWGIELLRLLLRTMYDAVKAVRPDALVVAHAPNPGFATVADAVRLNDLLRLDDPVPLVPVVAQMRHRAAIARAAVPGLLIETDDWGAPSLAEWRRFLAVKPELGIPSLYYVDRLDLTDERLAPEDYAAIRATWAEWRRRHGLPEPGASEARGAAGEPS